MKCEYCNNNHDGNFASGRFCNIKCSRGYSTKNKRMIINEKVSKSLSGRKGRIWTDDDRTKLSKSMIGNTNFSNRVEKIITKCRGCGEDIEHRITEKRKYHADCWLKNSGGFRKNSTRKHRSIYKGYQMDSGAEKEFAILLDDNNIKWIKNQGEIWFRYIDIKGKKRKYYPDFYLPDYEWWVEIKGKYYENENDILKLKAVGNIELMYHDDLKLPICI